MDNLTDKFRAGTLKKQEYYYIKYEEFPPFIAKLCEDNIFYSGAVDFADEAEGIEVLAEVPIFKEYLESESHCEVLRIAYEAERKKNTELEKKHEALARMYTKAEEDRRSYQLLTGQLFLEGSHLQDENKQLKEQHKKAMALLKKCRRTLKTYAEEDETCGLEEENKLAKKLLPEIAEALKNTKGGG